MESDKEEKSSAEQFGEVLKDCGITQVTFTGWKAELEQAEKKIKQLQFMVDNGLSEEEFYANHDTDKDPTKPLRPEDVIWVHEEALDELEGTDVSEISTADFFIGSAEELAKSSGGSPRALHYWTPFVRREKGKQPCQCIQTLSAQWGEPRLSNSTASPTARSQPSP